MHNAKMKQNKAMIGPISTIPKKKMDVAEEIGEELAYSFVKFYLFLNRNKMLFYFFWNAFVAMLHFNKS